MKNQFTREQIIGASVGGVFFLVAVGLGIFGWGAMGDAQNEAQALADRKMKPELASILGRPGGAKSATQEASEMVKFGGELAGHEEAMVGSWRDGFAQASGQGQEWSTTPLKWKEKLIAANEQVRKRAGKKGSNSKVILAEDFYLGLQDYKSSNPTEEEIPSLARQLSVAERLTGLLIEAKEGAREEYPTQCLLQVLELPLVKAAANPEGAGKPKPGPSETGPIRESYRLQLECSPEVLYTFIRKLATDPWLFILSDLRLESEQEDFPKRSEVAKKFEGEKNQVPGEAGTEGTRRTEEKPPLLLVLAGKERVKALLRVDFVGWRSPSPGKATQKEKSP
jgi:hypothetical protein